MVRRVPWRVGDAHAKGIDRSALSWLATLLNWADWDFWGQVLGQLAPRC